MKSKSRINNVVRNLFFSIGCQIINLLINFISRTVFIHILSEEYLGINSLFTNVLTIISFAELGIGNAIVFHLYKPIATNDIPAIKSLMDFYKKAYRYIGMIVAFVGLLMIPFLGVIINEEPAITENLTVIYLLFLFDTASSYFFTYKKTIIIADQQNYVVDMFMQLIKVVQAVIQVIMLILTKNYMLYLLIQIASTFICNIVIACRADKMYPYLKEPAEKLSRSESRSIFRDVKALVMYKFGSVILNGTDNIIISAMINVAKVGIVSNYNIIILACQSILGRVSNAFVASIGNANAVETDEKKYGIFRKVFFINSWLYGYFAMVLLFTLNDLVTVWIGEKYVLDNAVVFALILHFYVFGVLSVTGTYRSTLGLFTKGKTAPILAAVINIALSIILGKIYGLAGIFFATSVARTITMGIIDPMLIYQEFGVKARKYHINHLKHITVYTLILIITEKIISLLPKVSILTILIKCVIVTIVFNGIMIVVFGRTKVYGELLCIVKKKIEVILKR